MALFRARAVLDELMGGLSLPRLILLSKVDVDSFHECCTRVHGNRDLSNGRVFVDGSRHTRCGRYGLLDLLSQLVIDDPSGKKGYLSKRSPHLRV
ncbi:hypothetical protein C8C89_3179 [Janthinobacterium sp. 75]|nr:hypothetical protein C8C89_3179 [Janthinobacterium sp. 75]